MLRVVSTNLWKMSTFFWDRDVYSYLSLIWSRQAWMCYVWIPLALRALCLASHAICDQKLTLLALSLSHTAHFQIPFPFYESCGVYRLFLVWSLCIRYTSPPAHPHPQTLLKWGLATWRFKRHHGCFSRPPLLSCLAETVWLQTAWPLAEKGAPNLMCPPYEEEQRGRQIRSPPGVPARVTTEERQASSPTWGTATDRLSFISTTGTQEWWDTWQNQDRVIPTQSRAPLDQSHAFL